MAKRTKVKRKDNPEGRMSLVDHLLEFRDRLIKCALALVAMSIVGWIKYDWVYAQLTSPIRAVAEKRNLQDVIVNLNYAGATAARRFRVMVVLSMGLYSCHSIKK